MTPKISIILPIYNVAEYLPRSLDSLINQTLTDIEIICVNDASPDNCGEILQEYATKDLRITVITHETNKGAAGARQSGLNIASGEYIGFVDPDDYVDIDFFDKLYCLAIREQADIAKGNVATIELDNSITYADATTNDTICQNKFKFFGQNLWDAIYKSDMIHTHNIHFEIDIFCFGLQAAFWANKIVTRNDAIYNYVRREDSCDSKYFTPHKWKHWNIRGAHYYTNLLNTLKYSPATYIDLATNFIFPLFFYGYNRLKPCDKHNEIDYLSQELAKFGKSLKYKDMFANKLGVYSRAILSSDTTRIKRLLKINNIRLKAMRKLALKFVA